MMDAKQAIEIGEKIAADHVACVLAMINDLGASTEQALRGNQVWLATQIMKAMQTAERDITGPTSPTSPA